MKVNVLYSVLQPRSREDCTAGALTRCALRGVHRKCAHVVNIIRAGQRRQVDLSPSGAKVTNEYGYTSTAVMALTELCFYLLSSYHVYDTNIFGFVWY